jgi:signal transduction histidine kinase
MLGPKLARLRSTRSHRVYRGPDRRKLITRTTRPVEPWSVSFVAAGVVALPLAAAAFMTGSALGAWETGLGDAALIAYGAAGLLLALRWRLVGDAMCVPLASAAGLIALGFVPATIHIGANPAPVAALRLASVAVLMAMIVRALGTEEVRSDASPVRSLTTAFAVTALLTVPFGIWPLAATFTTQAGRVVVGLFEAAALIGLALALVVAGIQRRRMLLVGLAATALFVAASNVLRSLYDGGVGLDFAALCLLAGAVELLVAVAGELHSAIGAVVLHDVRGSRRWEAAEAELDEMRTSVQGRRHDLGNMLSALDGTLLVLGTQRHQMAGAEVDRLLGAVRKEVQWLQLVVGGGIEARTYDLSELLWAIADVRASGPHELDTDIEPDLVVRGRPDRVAIAVDNLLQNVAVHAKGTKATVRARRLPGLPEFVEVTVADAGPGLQADELALACTRGWRGRDAEGSPGSGLGLAQCRHLVASEGGEMELAPTNHVAGNGTRGLTVRLRIPVRQISNFADGKLTALA